ncbi:DUF4105 domain-containing protein [Pseudoxanthomonas sp.]|uniref:DUF7844 domain-containing protein n=1 Tax=Pseudoxanthomonas sp. TaxID=1871049 RepID=UPI00258735AA|nr:DUF4105 domain-containing protein [Pseudoxanthomonas sp.]MCR6686239.1 DUF4105 domain-containing protein [Pseudoxanthomonas sp.]
MSLRGAVLLAWLLASGQAVAGPTFELHGTLSPQEYEATHRLLDAAAARLPAAWAASLDRPIAVEWRDDLPAGVHGRARHWRMLLDRDLLVAWMARPTVANGSVSAGIAAGEDTAPAAAPDPAAASRAALAAVVHELAHLHDRTAAGGLSRDPRLLDLAGWQVAALRPGRRGRNDFRDRSPDPYELHSPREYLAVNLEHYLLDPDYACRRPALAAYFDARFGQAPADRAACAPGLAFVQDAVAAGEPVRIVDPERIFAVDYLLAEGNARPMSRWGHSMLRLVVCAPGRPRGPDCRLDLQHHLVLSFRAFVDDLQISSWRGLTGSYPSRLFALPLDQVVDEYTRVELRGLGSWPLALSRPEIEALAGRAAQLHWNYDGRYWFVANNCAVETWKLLHDASPRLAASPLRSITPTGLRRRLERQGLIDAAAVPADPGERVRLGFRFEPASAHYAAMYAVARAELYLVPDSAEDWLALPPATRAPELDRAGLRAAAALLVLESAAWRRQQALARDELKRRWLGAGDDLDGVPAATADALRDFLRLGGAFSRPAAWLDGVAGYGLPQAGERAVVQARVREDAQHRAGTARMLESQLRELLPASRRAALEGTEANLALLGARLRALDDAPPL